MAVYKATYCYPMLNSIDIRTALSVADERPVEWLKCRIDSSNKRITGYRIRILDKENNQIFPASGNGYISPMSEIEGMSPENDDQDANTGLNGTFAYIPFFQTYDASGQYGRLVSSYNAVYYKPKYKVDYAVGFDGDTDSPYSWSYDPVSDTLYKETWDGKFDGEDALIGERVLMLAAAAHETCGIWVVREDGTLRRDKDADGNVIDGTALQGTMTVIAKGTQHNSVYQMLNGYFSEVDQSTVAMWVDVRGNPITALSVDGITYKWEITFYQGELPASAVKRDNVTGVGYVYRLDYSVLANEWFDMMLNSGTILGSTNKRIQIGSDPNIQPTSIPQGDTVSPLVLEGKFVQLLQETSLGSESYVPFGDRAYIQSYDSTHGHIYPKSNSFDLQTIKSALTKKVAVYKHSNDPEYILDADMVMCASTGNIEGIYDTAPSYPQSYWDDHTVDVYWRFPSQPSSSTTEIDGVAVFSGMTCIGVYGGYSYKYTRGTSGNWTSEPLGDNAAVPYTTDVWKIAKGDTYAGGYFQANQFPSAYNKPGPGLPTIDGYKVQENDLVLVMDQENAWENGVYIAHGNGTNYFKNVRWERSGSYDQWGDFIGAIIYVRYGSARGGRNYESLASPGGELYSTQNVSSGNSPLYFIEERPIQLFGTADTEDVDLYYNSSGDLPSVAYGTTQVLVDSIPLQVGMRVLKIGSGASMEIYRVSGVVYRSFTGFNDSDGDAFVTADGYDFQVVDHEYPAPTDDSVAVVVQYELEKVVSTSGTRAYFSVATGEHYGHHLVSRYGTDNVNTDDMGWFSAWILKNTQTRTYVSPYVGMGELMRLKLLGGAVAPFVSGPSQWMPIESIDKTLWCITHPALSDALPSADAYDPSVPYKYEVRSFYKSSDENPFYSNEAPYLLVSEASSGISNVLTNIPYLVDRPLPSTDEENYGVWISDGDHTVEDYLVKSQFLSAISDRFVTLKGVYKQFQQASWESYRWVLTDFYGNVLQDTGNKYDKDMKVTFYGLFNDTDDYANRYVATLYVEDSLGITTSFSVRLVVDPDSFASLNIPFTAEYECDTHSVKLSYADNGFVKPSVRFSGTDYVYDGDSMASFGLADRWDSSLSYSDGYAVISGPNGANGLPIGQVGSTGRSKSETLGVSYSHYFKENALLVRSNEQQLTTSGDEVCFCFGVSISDDYCGQITRFDLTDAVFGDSCAISIVVPDNFSIPGTSLFADRNILFAVVEHFDVYGERDGYASFPLGDGHGTFTRFDASSVEGKYYMQPYSVEPRSDAEYLRFELKSGYVGWSHGGDGMSSPAYNSSKPYGNLGLVTAADLPVGETIDRLGTGTNTSTRCNGAPGFWVEGRPRLAVYSGNRLEGYDAADQVPLGINVAKAGADGLPINGDENGILKWPSDDTSAYWLEQNPTDYMTSDVAYEDPSMMYPSTWDAAKGSANGAIARYKACPRHPGASLSSFRCVLSIEDITKINTAARDAIADGKDIEDVLDLSWYDSDGRFVFKEKSGGTLLDAFGYLSILPGE